MYGMRRTPHPCTYIQRNHRTATTLSGGGLPVQVCVGTKCGGWVTPAIVVSELSVDTRQVPLCRKQGIFVLERSDELSGVAGQVGLFAGEAIPSRLQFTVDCRQDVVDALEEANAVGRHLRHIECAGSRVLQGIALFRTAQAEPDCAAACRPHRYLEAAAGGDRR